MDFAEYLRKSEVSENSKVYYGRFLRNRFHERYCYIDDLQCFRFCRKFDACALRGRPDQNKHSGSRHFVSTA